jgi:phosphate transport system substrate-binding protein
VPDEIDLSDYEPFGKNGRGTKVAILPEPSSLKLSDNLPKIYAATALYPLCVAFAQAVYPEGNYSLVRNESPVHGSHTALVYGKLIDGKADIIFCARPSNEQIERAKEKGINFNMTPIGKEAFVFFVNKKNPVINLSIEQVRNIYSGKVTNWSELGGRHRKIKAYQRPIGSGSQTILGSIMGEEQIVTPSETDLAIGMLDIIKETAAYRNYNNAIGYSFLFYTTQMVRNNKIKILSINGVLPSKETILDETYFYADNFYAITTNTDNENANKFIDWILSEQGQYLVDKTGYVSIK